MSEKTSRLRAFFATVCKMTCLGGSEKGTCECKSPAECKAKFDVQYESARREAMERMRRYVHNLLVKP